MDKHKSHLGPVIFLISYQVILLLILPFYFYYATISWGVLAASFILLYLTGLSVTAGYHRYFSHPSYKAHPIVELMFIIFGSMAGQGSILRWAYDHRLHHTHVDTDKDPYNINKGFWYAHFLWLFDKPNKIDPKMVPDLMRKPLIMLQDRWYPTFMISTNLIAFLAVGFLFNDFLGAFVLAWWTRFFVLHHCTWFINSLAHTWGDKPFCQEQTAVNNFVIALLTFGEGYHNYHHVYANDYRNGIRWYHFDPTKWLIWSLSKLGLTWKLRKIDSETINKRMILERKSLLLERLKDACGEKKVELEEAIQTMADQLMNNLAMLNRLRQDYLENKGTKSLAKELKIELKSLKKQFQVNWKQWIQLSRDVNRAVIAQNT